MTDKKISALTSATTPLAGTEVLPIVQGGATVKVAVSDLTAGRAISTTAITASSINFGSTPATAGAVRLNNNDQAVTARNAANSGNVDVVYLDNLNRARLAPVATSNVTILTAGNGVSFTANTPLAGMTSQLLNWYEAGTWTPTDGSGAGLTLTNNGSYYRRVGSLVVATLDVTYPATASGSTLILAGFPFIGTLVSDAAGSIAYTDYLPTVPVFLQLGSAVSGLRMLTAGAFLTNAGVSTNRFQITVSYFV
jgi:hypothetical protein